MADREMDGRAIVAARKAERERSYMFKPKAWIGTATQSQLDFPYLVNWGFPEKFHQELAVRGRPTPTQIKGIGGSPGVVEGIARVVLHEEQFDEVRAGDILVCHMTNPAWVVLFTKIAALVTNAGGITAHPAVLSAASSASRRWSALRTPPSASRTATAFASTAARASSRSSSGPRIRERVETMVGVAQRLSPLQQTAATATDIWNDSCAVDELTYAIEHGAVGATANPTIVHDVWKKDPKRWAGRVRELMTERPQPIRSRPGVVDRRGDVARWRPTTRAGFPALRRTPGPAVDADQPDLLAQPRADARPGRPLHVGRAQHHRQVPGHEGRHRRDGRGDLSRRVGQLHGLVLGRPGRRGRRGGRARAATAGSGRAADATTWARSSRSWSAASRTGCACWSTATASSFIRRRSPIRALRSSSGRIGSSGAKVPRPTAGRRHPPPPPLVGVRRRRRRHHPAVGVAEEVQRVRRSTSASGWTTRSTRSTSTSCVPPYPISSALTSRTA